MGWASEQFRRDLGIPEPSDNYYPSKNTTTDNKQKEIEEIEELIEELPDVDPNIKCMQATIEWKYFDKRIELLATIDTLIEEGYHIDNVIPKTSYLKKEGTTILLTEAIIIVSK